MTGSFLCNFCSWLLVISTASTLALSISSSNGNRQKRISIVTGANGYVGREVVNVLLNNNNDNNSNNNNGEGEDEGEDEDVDEILCLVRSHRVASETKYWSRFKSSLLASSTGTITPTIKVLPYDMLDGGKSITDALNAAVNNDNDNVDPEICVYHIASVFGPSDDHIMKAKENVQGTKDLVCAIGEFQTNASTCCRLVLTSSMAAVRGSGQIPMNDEYYTHQDWNTQSKLEDNNWGASYQWSKAESEQIAWELANDMKIKMTSICPSFVFGPPTSIPSLATTDKDSDTTNNLSNSFSITLFGEWVRGTSPIQSRLFVDVRDVAKAHVAAGTKSDAIGQRIIVSTEARIPSKEMAEILKDVCTESGLSDPEGISFDSTFKGGAIQIGSQEVESTDRLNSLLGITLTPVHET
jgi:nucleoside-diphosphate-sugar epimerase